MNRSDLNSLVQAKIIDNNTEEISPGDVRDVLAEYSTSQLNIEDDFELYGLRTMSARPYLVDEYFVFDGAIYQVITAHVAGTTPDLTKVVKIADNNSGGGIADWVAGPVEAGKVYNYNGVLIRRDGGAITSSNPATEGGWKFLQNEMTTVSVVSSNLVYDCKGKESVSFFSQFSSDNNTALFTNCPDGAMVRLVINNNSSTDKILNLAPPSLFGDSYNRIVINKLTLIPGINTFLLLKNKTIFGIESFYVLGTKVIAESNAVNEVYNITSWSGDFEKSATRAVLFDKFEADKTYYLDQIAQVREGLAPKTPVDVTIESNINLAITHTTLDGETVNVGFRVALIGQTDLSENGIYVADGTGLLTRASDMNAATEFLRAYFYTESGTNAGKRYIVSQAPAIVDTDDCIIIYQNSFVVPSATEVAEGAVELADSTEVDNTIALSTEPATATNKVVNLKQFWRFLEYLKTLFLTQSSALSNYEFKNRTFSRSTNLALATPNIQTQVIRNSGSADISVFTNYTGCKINGQINKSVIVKPGQFATIKAIDSSDPDNHLVFVTDEVPVAGGGGSGNSITITAGEALVARNLVYLDTDGKYRKADYLIQSRIASEILIVEDATIANDATGTATLRGIVTGFTGLTVGSNYYVGENGAIVSEANLPDIDGMFQKYIGEAVSETTLNFNPSSHYYEIEVTGVVDGLATVRTLVDQHWFVVDGKPNVDGTGTLTNGSEVRSIISKTGGLGGNRAVYQDLTEPAITQQIPTRPNGGVPTYINNEGGFLHIANGLDIQYRFLNNLGDIDATGEFWYVCRLHTGKSYEAIMSGDRGPELKRLNTGVMQYNPNDYVTANQTFSYTPIEFETIIFHFIYNKTAGTCNIRVTDSVGDYRDLTTKTIPTTSILRNFGVGTSSHPASHDFFAYLFKFGSEFNTTDRATILSNLKATYPIGQLPSKSFARPTMGYNNGTTTFTITPNYVLRGGATSINNASTVVRWYMLKNNVSTGTYPNDALANITLIATTTGNQLSLNISSYPQFVTGGAGVGDEIVGAITVFDNLGAAFEIECGTDPRRTI